MSSVTVAGLAGGGVWRSTVANIGERTAADSEPQYSASRRVIQSAPPPLLFGNLLDMGVPCALTALYIQSIDCICDNFRFQNVMKNQGID